MRTITNPANNSPASSSGMRNELQTLETEIASTSIGHTHNGTDSKQTLVNTILTTPTLNSPILVTPSGIGKIGYAAITSDFTTATTPALVDVTNLATTVTVPTGGRSIKITVHIWYMNGTEVTGAGLKAAVLEGSTQLGAAVADMTVAGYGQNYDFCCVVTPTAGSHTYKVAVSQSAAGTLTIGAGATYPAFILVELI
jgi:hypothetical protein